jgi:small subunit ribosomal protein S4e
MPKGPRKHMKRLAAPSHWMLDKMGGIFATRPFGGNHKQRECLPLILLLRNRLKYALTGRESMMILKQRFVEVDGKSKTENQYPVGFMDVVTIKKTNDYFRILFDTKGRFLIHKISKKESSYKLLKVVRKSIGPQGVPFIICHDGRQIRFPHPEIQVSDTVKYHIESKKITKFVKFENGNLCYVTGGANRGRIGEVIQKDVHEGSFSIVHIKDVAGNTFTTRLGNVFIIGPKKTSWITLPKGKGLKLSTIEDRKKRIKTIKDNKRSKKSGKKTTEVATKEKKSKN